MTMESVFKVSREGTNGPVRGKLAAGFILAIGANHGDYIKVEMTGKGKFEGRVLNAKEAAAHIKDAQRAPKQAAKPAKPAVKASTAPKKPALKKPAPTAPKAPVKQAPSGRKTEVKYTEPKAAAPKAKAAAKPKAEAPAPKLKKPGFGKKK